MKSYGGVEAQLHSFLTLALDGSKRSISDSVGFTPGEEAHVTHRIRVNVGPRAGHKLRRKEKSLSAAPRIEHNSLAVHSVTWSQYRLSCRGSRHVWVSNFNLDIRWRWEVSYAVWPFYSLRRAPCIHWLGDCVGPNSAPGFWGRQKSLVANSALEGGKYVYSYAYRNSWSACWIDW